MATSSTLTCSPSSIPESKITFLPVPLATSWSSSSTSSSSTSRPPFPSLPSSSSVDSPSTPASSPPSTSRLLNSSKVVSSLPQLGLKSTNIDTNSRKRSASSAFGLDNLDVDFESSPNLFDWEGEDYDQTAFHRRLNPFSPFRPFSPSLVPRKTSIMRNVRGEVYDDENDQSVLGLYSPYDGSSYAHFGQPQQPQLHQLGHYDQHTQPIQPGAQPLTPHLSQPRGSFGLPSPHGPGLDQLQPMQQPVLSELSGTMGSGDEEGVALLSAAAAGLVPMPTTPFRQSTLSPQSPSLHTPSLVTFDMQLAPLDPSPVQTPPLTPFMPFVGAPMMPPPAPVEESRDLLALIRPTPIPHLPMPRGFCLSSIHEGDVPKLVQMVSSIPRPAGRKLISKLLANNAPSFPSSTSSSYPSSVASFVSGPSARSGTSSGSSYSPSPFPEADEQTLRSSIQSRVGQQTVPPGQPGLPGWRYNVIRRNSNFDDIVGLIILEPVERDTFRSWIPGAEVEDNTWMFGAVIDPSYMGMGVATSTLRTLLQLWFLRQPAGALVSIYPRFSNVVTKLHSKLGFLTLAETLAWKGDDYQCAVWQGFGPVTKDQSAFRYL